VVGELFQAGKAYAQEKVRTDVAGATAATAADMEAFAREFDGKTTYTREEIKAMGVEDLIETKDGDDEKQTFLYSEVWPIALQKRSEETIAKYSKKIAFQKAQTEWSQGMQRNHNAAVTNAYVQAEKSRAAESLQMSKNKIEAYWDLGLFGAAAAEIEGIEGNASLKTALKLDNAQRMEMNTLEERLMSTDVVDLQAFADEFASDKYQDGSVLSAADRRKFNWAFDSRISSVVREQAAERTRQSSSLTNAIQLGIFEGVPTSEVLATYNDVQSKLTTTDNRYIQGAIRDMISGVEITTPDVELAWFQNKVMDIRMGVYTGTREEAINELEQDIWKRAYTIDPVTYQSSSLYAAADRKAMNSTLAELRDEPVKSQAFKDTVDQINLRIKGSVAGGWDQSSDPQSGLDVADAYEDLIEYARQNPRSDFKEWRRDRLWLYTDRSTSREIRIGGFGDYVVYSGTDAEGKASYDKDATQKNLEQAYILAKGKPEEQRKINLMIAAFDKWAEGIK